MAFAASAALFDSEHLSVYRQIQPCDSFLGPDKYYWNDLEGSESANSPNGCAGLCVNLTYVPTFVRMFIADDDSRRSTKCYFSMGTGCQNNSGKYDSLVDGNSLVSHYANGQCQPTLLGSLGDHITAGKNASFQCFKGYCGWRPFLRLASLSYTSESRVINKFYWRLQQRLSYLITSKCKERHSSNEPANVTKKPVQQRRAQ